MNFSQTFKNIIFIVVYILSGLALLLIVDGLMSGDELAPFNVAVGDALRPLRTPLLTTIFLGITNLGNPIVLFFAACFLAIILILYRDTYDAMLYLVSVIISIIAFVVLKNSFTMPRPEGGLIGLTGFSFPSGHATVATTFFFATAYSFFDWPKNTLKKVWLVGGCILATLLICLSRLYLGAHWALDVLAGIALGLMCVSFTALIFNIFLAEKGIKMRRRKSVLH